MSTSALGLPPVTAPQSTAPSSLRARPRFTERSSDVMIPTQPRRTRTKSAIKERGEPTSGLEPLTCSLRVRGGEFIAVHHCTEIRIGTQICVTIAHHGSPLSKSGCRQSVVNWFDDTRLTNRLRALVASGCRLDLLSYPVEYFEKRRKGTLIVEVGQHNTRPLFDSTARYGVIDVLPPD